MFCNQCGGTVFEIAHDHYNGSLYACERCNAKSDHTEVIEDEITAAKLAEWHEEAIAQRQEREIAILKAAAPGMVAIDDNDLDRLTEVLNG